MQRGKARVTDLMLTHKDGAKENTYTKPVGAALIPSRKLHSQSQLRYQSYLFAGELELDNIPENAVAVTIDAYAYRARHQTDLRIIHLSLGNIRDQLSGKQFSLKLAGIVKGENLYVLTSKANKGVSDIAPYAPIRVSGMSQLYSIIRKVRARFSSNKSKVEAA